MRVNRPSMTRDGCLPTHSEGERRVPSPQGNRRIQKLARPKSSFLLGFVVFGILVLAACGSSSSSGNGASGASPAGGGASANSPTANLDPAPDFQFSLYQGEEALGAGTLRLSDLQGKPLVLNFWAGLCPPCRAEMPDLQAFYGEFGDKVNLFGLDVGPFTALGSNQAGRELLEELAVSYPAGTTTGGNVVRDYSILGMPSTVFITADGKIFRKWGGLLTEDKLGEITEDMLALTGTAVSETR